MLPKRLRIAVLLGVFAVAGVLSWAPPLHARAELPTRLTDAEFWNLTDELSEPNGSFRSDNFLSNEIGYQTVIPDLLDRVKPGAPGGVYLGVAPEINFSYIAAVKPHMAFIIDIRRGNLHEHLLYKALFEMSSDRADFLSRLFSRKRPAGISATSTIDQMFAAYDTVQPTEDLYKENFAAVIDWLKKHDFKLRADDPDGIGYVYYDAFFKGGPNLNYSFGSGGGMGGGNSPTYEQLMLANDGTGTNRSYLASEENFAFIKDFETRNLLVPVVGNFAGPKAIRAVGTYLRQKGATVSAFYLSNVEQYLYQDGVWREFCGNVAALPLDETSAFIRAVRGGRYGPGFGLSSELGSMATEVKSCGTAAHR
jgi:hypothetical protein